MPRFKDQAVVIRVIEWSETSQIVALLTRERGLVRGIAKGSQRMSPSSVQRYSGGFELLTMGEAVGMIRTTSELATLTEWDLQRSYHALRGDWRAMQYGLYAADLTGAMIADSDPHAASFEALVGLLDAMAGAVCEVRGPGVSGVSVPGPGGPGLEEGGSIQWAMLLFQWRLLEDCGYRPTLDVDARTNEPLDERAALSFDARAGGVTAGAMPLGATMAGGPWRVRPETVRLLRAAAEGDDAAAAAASDAALLRANRLLCVYARTILDKELPTMRAVLGE